MNNFKKIALSLLVVGLAIGTQAFTNAVKMDENDVFVTRDGTTYEYISTANYVPGNCLNTAGPGCSYKLTELGAANIDRTDTFTDADIASYLTLEWIEKASPRNGLYAD
jgi:hypothetical protein